MNLHQTQSIQTMCELMDFAAVPYHIITPKDGKNIIDFVQDTMLASYRLTKDHVRIREKSMANLQMVNSYFNGKLPTPIDSENHLYTGKQAYSAILPPGLMMEGKNRTGQKVIVYDGQLKEGTLDKGVYNAMSEGLIPRIFHDYGPFEARRFLDNTQRLMCRWLMMSGFSCGISDLVIEPKTVDKFKTIVQSMKEQAYRRIQEVRNGGLDNHSIFKNNDFFEMELVSKLQAAFDEIGSEGLNQINDLTNRMINMVKSGSKGSEMNVAQMIGALGQQLIDGKRIQYGFTDRTLPHYTKFDDGPEARGFVENSFIKGLEPHEVFFHAMGGREGLIDTAVKSVSGDTPIVVLENGQPRYVEIGEWIDQFMEKYPRDIVVEDDRPDLDFLKIDDKVEVYIPTGDDKGLVSWGQLTAVTRHDTTEYIYEVETAGGRTVTVADSETLLVWDSAKEGYYKKHSSLVREGDIVPVVMNMVKPPQITEYVDMRAYFPKTEHSHLPDKFALDYENGVMCGLYLADGCIHEKSDTISITKEDESVQAFVCKWFDKYGITHRLDVCKKEHGVSTSIIGSSTLFAQFFNKWMGHGARVKHIPDVAYTAPEEFVKGLLSGYISGDGSIEQDAIHTSSASRRLIEGIAFLCSRLGAFGKISVKQLKSNNLGTVDIAPTNCLSIRAQWARILSKELELIHTVKNEKLKTMGFTEEHRNFKEMKDTVMDPIVKITKMKAEGKYAKLYDVTVPSTLNFMIGNGLTCRDTSETGYIQRRMVKAMEDCKVYYDNTVRNATGSVVQFIYGEDGMDGTKLEQQQLPYIQQSLLEMDHQYHLRKGDLPEAFLSKEAFAKIQKEDWEERATELYNKMVEDREFIITRVFKNTLNGSIIYPIPFKRLLRTAALKVSQVQLDSVPNDLTPMEIMDTIERLMDKLHVGDKEQGTQYLHLLLRLHLNPKMILLTHRLTKPVFEWVVAEIERYFYTAVVQPGETVGIIAAQSIGEPCTQLTLNSFHSSGTAAAVKATSGVPRLRELLSVSKNIKTPTLLIYLQPDIAPHKEKAEAVLQSLEMTKLGDILEMSEIFWDPPGAGFQTGVGEDKGLLDIYHSFSDLEEAQCSTVSPWVLRMKLNKQKMYRMGLRMMDIYTRLMSTNGSIVDCVFSDDNAAELILRIRLTQAGLKDIDPEDSIAALKAIEYNFVNGIGNSPLLLKGMQGIRKVSMRQQNQQRYNPLIQAYEKMSEWVLDTDGTNLMEILSNPNVDPVRTVSNDVREIFEVLGIEAARTALYNEIYNVIRDSSLNSRHLYLLVDTITNRGTLMSIDRHGINRADVGPLAKSSFEETTDMLIKAGVFSEFDRINGVSANIMLGQLPPCGTGDSEILLDEDMFIQLIQGATQAPEMAPIEKEIPTRTEACSVENLAFTYKLPSLPSQIQFPLPKVQFV